MTAERKISKATALDELSGLFEQVAADPGGEWLNGGHASTLGWAATTLTDFEARVRAEVAEGRGKIVDEALMAARDDLVKTADRLRAKARETGDKTHFGTAAGVSLACLRLVELADRARTPDLMAALKAELAAAREAPKAKPVVAAAGSSPDTTPEPKP